MPKENLDCNTQSATGGLVLKFRRKIVAGCADVEVTSTEMIIKNMEQDTGT